MERTNFYAEARITAEINYPRICDFPLSNTQFSFCGYFINNHCFWGGLVFSKQVVLFDFSLAHKIVLNYKQPWFHFGLGFQKYVQQFHICHSTTTYTAMRSHVSCTEGIRSSIS